MSLRFALFSALALLAVLLLAPAASAEPVSKEEALFRIEGRLPSQIATDPTTGHIILNSERDFSSGEDNFSGYGRIDEYTPWGEFVRGFGYDVAPGAVNETQEVRVRAAEGTFRLSFEGEETTDLRFDASGEEVEAALNALASIGGAGGEVSVSERVGAIDGATPFVHAIAFKGALAGTDVPQLEASDGAEALAGGDPGTELEVRTRASGTAAGTGLEACTAESGCQEGRREGRLGGEIVYATVAVGPGGDIYLGEGGRIQQLTSAGEFVRAFGGDTIRDGAAGTGVLSPGSETITAVETTEKAFQVGDPIEGVGIEPGTTIAGFNGFGDPNRIDLSQPAGPGATGEATALTVPPGAGNIVENDIQTITPGFRLKPTFKLDFSTPAPSRTSVTTAPIPAEADGAEVEEALLDGSTPEMESLATGKRVLAELEERRAEVEEALLGEPTPELEAELAELEEAIVKREETIAELEETLEGLRRPLEAGDIAVAGPSGGPWTVEFKGARYGGYDVPNLSGADNYRTLLIVTDQRSDEVCEVAAECQAPSPAGYGTGGYKLGLSPGGETLFAGIGRRIRRFGPTTGADLGDLPDPGGALARPAAETGIENLAVNPVSGNVYFDFTSINGAGEDLGGGGELVFELDPASGAVAGELDLAPSAAAHFTYISRPGALATAPSGELYAVSERELEASTYEHVVAFDSAGKRLAPPLADEERCEKQEGAYEDFCEEVLGIQAGRGNLNAFTGLGTGPAGNLYVSTRIGNSAQIYVQAYGPPPLGLESPPPAPPEIEDQYAVSVDTTGARLRGLVNPRFFSGALGPTRYRVQYATAACLEEGGWEAACVREAPSPPGAALGGEPVSGGRPVTVSLDGLRPATAYRYRFVAEGNGAPGVEIAGVGGKPGEAGAEGAFRTFAEAGGSPECPNAAFRGGPAGALPDCRAYELVSPVDKAGGDIEVLETTLRGLAVLERAASSGEKLAYGTYRAFGDSESAPYTAQYIATRGARAWSSEGISPPRTTLISTPAGQSARMEFPLFSEDLCQAWFRTFADPPLAPGAIEGHYNLYRRGNCARPRSYEALTTVEPEVKPPGYEIEVQGASADGETTIFTTTAKLTGSAPIPPKDEPLLYAHGPGGELVYVCVLPGGAPSAGPCIAGGPRSIDFPVNQALRLDNAISDDGKRIYWVDRDDSIYLREDPLGAGTTAQVAGRGSQYWGAAEDGSKAVYERRRDLFVYDAEAEASTKVAGKVTGVAGMSADASRVYFVSVKDLDGEGPAAEGEDNLYLWEEGDVSFVAMLAGEDISFSEHTVASAQPNKRATRTSPDGAHLAFMSAAPLTGYDNTDAASGRALTEVFLYDAEAEGGAGRLICASCNPSGARATGIESSGLSLAAQIPVPVNNLTESRLLSADGARLFFESTDALALRDTNNVKDVYQWEREGAGSCDASEASFSPAAFGCIELISSGQSPVPSRFVEASPEGDDVFFTTHSSLVGWDPDLVDIYDARVGGGQPAPPAPAAECEGGACQDPDPAPEAPTPASATYSGPGNLTAPARGRCAGPARKARRAARAAKRLRRAARRSKAPAARRKRARAARRRAGSARRLSRTARRCRARARSSARTERRTLR